MGNLLSIVGFTISTISLFELADSFGVAPANRGQVKSGVYGYIKHPMYTGYVIAELGFTFLNQLNVFLFSLSVLLYFFRARRESEALSLGG